MQYDVRIGGMSCRHCVESVENALRELGAEVLSCEIGAARVAFDGEAERLRNAVEEIGFDFLEAAAR